MKRLIFMGKQGAGKGTVASRVKDEYKIPHISTGDMLRAAIKKGTEMGKLAADIVDAGKLIPDDIITKIVHERIAEPDCENGFILDGYPRDLSQANMFDREVTKVVLLEISDEDVIRRISGRRQCSECSAIYNTNPESQLNPKVEGKCDKCGADLYQRHDDVPDAIRKRLDTYHEETAPVAEFYDKQGLLVRVDASTPDLNDIVKRVIRAIDE